MTVYTPITLPHLLMLHIANHRDSLAHVAESKVCVANETPAPGHGHLPPALCRVQLQFELISTKMGDPIGFGVYLLLRSLCWVD